MIVSLPSADQMYQAVIDKDISFEGTFFTCVKTTGIFCKPTCRARFPKRKNVVFVGDTNEAIKLGYQPSKICKPLM